jgi:hypothetical protein
VFSSYFSLLGGRSHAGFFLLGLAPVCFSRLYSLMLPLFLLFLVRSSSVYFFSASCLYRLSVLSLLGLFPSSPPFGFSSLFLPASSSSGCSLGRRGCGCCDEVVQPVVAAVELEEDGVGFLWQRKKEEEEKSAEIG